MGSAVPVLFVNEGAVSGALGHARVEESLRATLGDHPDVAATFVQLPPMSAPTRLLVRGAPVLGPLDLDLQPLRWHAAQAVRARRTVRAALAAVRPRLLHVHTHSVALGLGDVMRRTPTFLSVDVTIGDFHALGYWRRVRPHTKATLRPSLALERRVLGAAAGVLAWTDWARRGVEAAAPGARAVVHHPGIDLTAFSPAPRPPARPLRVLFVGGSFERKGGSDLLHALRPLLGRHAELDVVTPGPVPAPDGVRVHRLSGSDPALLELYQQAHVFCLPTRADAAPFAILEAMACGTAVVATRVGGIPDLVGTSGAGALVPAADPGALRAAVERFLDEPALAGEMGAEARARCEAHFDARRQSVALVELMRGAL